jgi:guanylate kinase
MLYCLIGKTCSGKTTALKQLMDLGYKTIISYTTRPKRIGEVDGKDYHFVTEEQFEELSDSLVAKNTFISVYGTQWSYGKHIKDIDTSEDAFIIVEPSGYRELVEILGDHHIVGIYIDAPLNVRWLRGLKRGDDMGELLRRIKADEVDFKGIEKEVDYVITELDEQAVLDQILSIVGRGSQK